MDWNKHIEDLWFKVLHLQYAKSPKAPLAYKAYRQAMREAYPYALFLDDERSPRDVYWIQYPEGLWWRIVRNYAEFKEQLDLNGLPAFVSFDHDLQDFVGGTERTGKTCAMLLTDYCTEHKLDLPEYRIHTKNGPGSDNIASWFSSYLKAAPNK